jgi:hypothetical protein
MIASLATVACALVAGSGQTQRAPAPVPGISELRRSLDVMVARLLPADGLVRTDGHVYAIDVGLLALSAALGQDRQRYEQLVSFARSRLIQRPAGLTNPIVAWRRKLQPVLSRPDASGTTEALQLAQALFVGADAFARPGDRALAGQILDGYLEHAAEIDDVWLVRNYFNIQTRSFATNSYLIDYSPDLLDFSAAQRDSETYRRAATRSLALIRKSQRPTGLIDAIVQPELRTLYQFVIFSPNDIIELEHTALVAEQVAVSAPDVGQRVLRFSGERLGSLHAAYEGRSGDPHGIDRADAGTLAALVRLAVKLGDSAFIGKIRPLFAQHAAWVVRQEGTVDIHLVAQTLTGLQFLELWDKGARLPRAVPSRAPRS